MKTLLEKKERGLKRKERASLADVKSYDMNSYVDEVINRAPRLSDAQLDAVAGALDAKEARNV